MPRILLLLLPIFGCGESPADSKDADAEPPDVAFAFPVEGDLLTGEVTLEATADDDIGVTAVSFLANGVPIAAATGEPWSASWDTTGTVNGNYFLVAQAADQAGNTAEASVGVQVENEGGLGTDAVQIINPVDGAAICGAVTVEAIASGDITGFAFSLDGVALASDDASPFIWDLDTLPLENGLHLVQATATDSEGRQGAAAIRVDVQNTGAPCDNHPSVVFDSPEDGLYTDADVALSARASDDVGVVELAFYVDNALLLADASVPFESTWTTADFDEGPHSIKAIATDTAGQTGEARLTVTVDRTPPTVSLTSPSNGEDVAGTVTLTADAEDSGGVAEVEFYVDGDLVGQADTPPFEASWESTDADYGDHTIRAVAVDFAGHESWDELEVSVDNPPTIRLMEPDDGDTVAGALVIEAEADDDGGVRRVTLSIDGVEIGDDTSDPYTWTWDTCAATPGEHTVTVTASDGGGQTEDDANTVTVDQELEVELVSPSAELDATSSLNANVSDDDAVTEVAFDLDGTVVATVSVSEGSARSCTLTCLCEAYQASLDATAFADGSHTLTVTVTNAAGDTASDSTVVTITRDQDGDGHDALEYGGDDCDDDALAINPDATEVCNGVDDDCDALTDGAWAADATSWYLDADGDSYGDAAFAQTDCTAPSGYVVDATDCDDADADVFPFAAESCNGIDDDCDGTTDPSTAADADTWYADSDGDGWGSTVTARSCSAPAGYVATSGDCDPTDAWVNPDAVEVCDGVDNNCDGSTDAADARDASVWYADTDGDGYGDPATSRTQCTAPSGYVADATDCSVASATVHPGATEACNSVDDDCDGSTDEDYDDDGDGYLSSAECSAGDDCDDTDAAVSPGDAEVCGNDVDDDCDGTATGCAFWGANSFADADAKRTGETLGDYAGYAVGAGDFDGDGADELLVGALDNDRGGTDAGAVFVVSAPTGTASLSTADGVYYGEDGSDYAGGFLAAGDVDGDGDDDLLIGAWQEDAGAGNAGAAYLVSAGTFGTLDLVGATAKLVGEDLIDYAGRGVGMGDFDGDELADLIVGAPGDDTAGTDGGAAYIVFGPASGTIDLSTADVKMTSEQRSQEVGTAIDTADFDGDGIDDVLVAGASGQPDGGVETGAVYLIHGGFSGTMSLTAYDSRFIGADNYDYAGTSLAAGDFDGDGGQDVLIGAPGNGDGHVSIVYEPSPGDLDLSSADANLIGSASYGNYAGVAVAACDTDADDTDEIVVGAYQRMVAAAQDGAVYVVRGPVSGAFTLDTDADLTIGGEAAYDRAGHRLSCGDVDGDGNGDILMGTLYEGSSGAAYVLLGGPGL